MISFETERLICNSDLCVEKGILVECEKGNTINILNIKPTTGKENGFAFYSKASKPTIVCHIGIIYTRGRFEVSYGVDNESLRGQGYMTEALKALCGWLFDNTDQDAIWALPNGQYKKESISVLKKCGFQKADEEFGIEWYELKKR